MKFHYDILWWVIFIEMAIVFVIVILAFIYRYHYAVKKRKIAHLTSDLQAYLTGLIESNSQLTEVSFKKCWREMDLVLPILIDYRAKHNTKHWEEIERDLVNLILLPLARKGARSPSWIARMLAAQSFQFGSKPEDVQYIDELMNDKLPLIHLHAATAAIMNGNKELIFHLVKIMAHYNHYSHGIYLQLFQQSYDYIPGYMTEFLSSQHDPLIRWVCYEILLEYPPLTEMSCLNKDILSDNEELQITAIKYYTYLLKEKAVPKLLELLTTGKWATRVICLHSLGTLKDLSALPEIEKCLHDHVWWVRTAAAQALLKMGEQGLAILNSQNPELDRYAYDAAMHALNKPPEEKRIEG